MEIIDNIKNKSYSFKKGIRNLFYFFNVIWNYRDFDYGYMLDIEMKVLESMRKYFKSSNIAEGDDETARDLELCLNILKEREKCNEYWYAEEKEGHEPIKKINMSKSPMFYKNMIELHGEHKRLFEYDWYEYKCWCLYNKIRTNRMLTWWN